MTTSQKLTNERAAKELAALAHAYFDALTAEGFVAIFGGAK